MFCAIPFPGNLWDEKARDKMLLFLPLVGLEMGLLWAGIAWLCRVLALPKLMTGFVLGVYPYLVTGLIHLDGYMDVTDAVKSWRDLERRREILKDSHVGSFAVIGVVMLILGQVVVMASAPGDASLGILVLLPAMSRCGSALAVTALKPMATSQYAKTAKKTSHVVVILAVILTLLGAGFGCCGRYGFVLVGCGVGYALALRRGYHSLQGMNGDVAGYALTIGELCGLVVYALI